MIEGEGVRLRRVEPEDYPAIQRWQNEPEVARWMNYNRIFSLADIKASEEKATTEGQPYIIEVDGQPVGRIGLNNFRARDRMASLYLFIGERSVWGHGYARHALAALLDYGFTVLNLRKIELWALEGNERALHLYKRIGFVEDARLPERSWMEGRYVDNVVMSIDRDAFDRARADG